MMEYAITFYGYSTEDGQDVLNFWVWFAVGYADPTLHSATVARMAAL